MLQERVKKILEHDIEEVTNDGGLLIELLSLYRALFDDKKPCSFCKKEHKTYYQKIKNNGMAIAKIKDNREFELKKSICIYCVELGRDFTNFNITDEIAIKMLKGNKKRIANFSRYPDNWEELIDGKVEENPKTETKKRGRGRPKKIA